MCEEKPMPTDRAMFHPLAHLHYGPTAPISSTTVHLSSNLLRRFHQLPFFLYYAAQARLICLLVNYTSLKPCLPLVLRPPNTRQCVQVSPLTPKYIRSCRLLP
jgi:hypothetical protein